MKLWQKIVVYGLWIVVLPILLIGYLAFDRGRAELEADAIKHLEEISILKEAEFDRWIEDSADNLREAAQRPLLREYVAELAVDANSLETLTALRADHLLPILKEEATFLELFVLRAEDGLVLVSTDQAQEGKYKESEPYFAEGREQTVVQNAYYVPDIGQGVISIATPVYDEEGGVNAVLAAHLDLTELSDIMAQGRDLSATEETYLINSSNLFVTESRFAAGYPFTQSIHTAGVDDCLAGKDGAGLYEGYRGVPVIGAYRWIPERDLCIVTEIEQQEAFAPVVAFRNATIGITVLVALLAAALASIFVRTITRPLGALVKGVQHVGDGLLDYRIPVHSRDEVGELSRAFNAMAEKLSRSSAELRLNEERYRTVADFAYDWEYWVDPNGNYIYTSPSSERISGYRPEEFQQDPELLARLIHPEDRPAVDRRQRRGRPCRSSSAFAPAPEKSAGSSISASRSMGRMGNGWGGESATGISPNASGPSGWWTT